MKTPVIAFFNNKGGVGKTTLVHHLAWTFADLGKKVLAADLDPQANLTASFLDEEQIEELWSDSPHQKTIYDCIKPLLDGIGDIPDKPYLEEIDENLFLLPGDLDLGLFEGELAQEWPKCSDGHSRAFRVMSSFWRIMQKGAGNVGADIIIIDMGPNLGSINRATLVASDYLVVPLTPDLYSLQGLKNIGPTIRKWRNHWKDRLPKNPVKELDLPGGDIEPLGYIAMQHAVRADRPVKAYERWVKRIPVVYAKEMMRQSVEEGASSNVPDPNCIGLVKHYRSLMPMALEARKPMFHLLPADGAIGSHYNAVKEAGKNFRDLAAEIEKRYKKKEKKQRN